MTREEAKALLPIIKAFSEGKTIQSRCIKGDTSLWYDDDDFSFDDDLEYRIKPSPTYRPFANADECWNEMLKHQPVGWVIKHKDEKELIVGTRRDGIQLYSLSGCYYDFDEANRILTFADGSAFGVKESEE